MKNSRLSGMDKMDSIIHQASNPDTSEAQSLTGNDRRHRRGGFLRNLFSCCFNPNIQDTNSINNERYILPINPEIEITNPPNPKPPSPDLVSSHFFNFRATT